MAEPENFEKFSYTPQIEEKKGTVSSLRLDSLLALAFSSSRTKLVPYIENGSGQVYDMELDEMADLNTSVQAAAPGKIDSHSILFYGRCYSCMEKEETENTLKKSS